MGEIPGQSLAEKSQCNSTPRQNCSTIHTAVAIQSHETRPRDFTCVAIQSHENRNRTSLNQAMFANLAGIGNPAWQQFHLPGEIIFNASQQVRDLAHRHNCCRVWKKSSHCKRA